MNRDNALRVREQSNGDFMAVTDAEGRAVLPLTASPPCTVSIAAVVKNARPAGGTLRVLAAGPHVLEVRRAGFHEWSREVELEAPPEDAAAYVALAARLAENVG